MTKTFYLDRNDMRGKSIDTKENTFYKIFNWRCDQSEVYNDEPSYWFFGTAIWTAIKTGNGWTQTLLVDNGDMDADGPLACIVKVDNELWSFKDVDIYIREAFANSFVGKLDPHDDEETQDEWWSWFNLAYITYEAYLDEEVGVTKQQYMSLSVA